MSAIWLSILIAFNTIGAGIFAFRHRKKGSYGSLAIFFFMVPVIGFVVYLMAYSAWSRSSAFTYDRESLVHWVRVDKGHEMPEIEKALDVIPVEDAMAISSNAEKRQLMLEQLKKDINNYRNILSASADHDSETAHYVASAKMEVYNKLTNDLKKATRQLRPAVATETIYPVLRCYLKIIDSNILTEEEVNVYRDKYIVTFEGGQEIKDFEPDTELYDFYLNCLIERSDYDKIKHIWRSCSKESKTEQVYWKILEMYYRQGDKDGFYRMLDELCASDITLSADGVDMLRFWLEKKNQKR